MVLWPIKARVIYELFYNNLYRITPRLQCISFITIPTMTQITHNTLLSHPPFQSLLGENE